MPHGVFRRNDQDLKQAGFYSGEKQVLDAQKTVNEGGAGQLRHASPSGGHL